VKNVNNFKIYLLLFVMFQVLFFNVELHECLRKSDFLCAMCNTNKLTCNLMKTVILSVVLIVDHVVTINTLLSIIMVEK